MSNTRYHLGNKFQELSSRTKTILMRRRLKCVLFCQGRRKVWKSGAGGASSIEVGIICLNYWDKYNYSAKSRGHCLPPPGPPNPLGSDGPGCVKPLVFTNHIYLIRKLDIDYEYRADGI